MLPFAYHAEQPGYSQNKVPSCSSVHDLNSARPATWIMFIVRNFVCYELPHQVPSLQTYHSIGHATHRATVQNPGRAKYNVLCR